MWTKLLSLGKKAYQWWNGLDPGQQAAIKKNARKVGDILKDKAAKRK